MNERKTLRNEVPSLWFFLSVFAQNFEANAENEKEEAKGNLLN